jgi:FG-GAP repeat
MANVMKSRHIGTAPLVLIMGALMVLPPSGPAHGKLHLDRNDDPRDRGGDARARLKDCLRIGSQDNGQGEGRGRQGQDCLPVGSSSGVARGDFNGDTFADLAVGVPLENTPSGSNGIDAGAVNVIYGSANGLTGDGTVPDPHFFSQNAVGVPFGTGEVLGSERGDHFGSALASGDFNGDNFSDLAIGVPLEDTEASEDGGRVVVIYGSSNGLAAAGAPVLQPQSFDIADFLGPAFAFADEEFGRALAWGDFDGDGFGDLAVGAPGLGEHPVVGTPFCGNLGFPPCPPPPSHPGAVFVLFGSEDGLSAAIGQSGAGPRQQRWSLDSNPTIPGNGGDGDRFGDTLVAGDFDGDRVTDLAIGIPFRTLGVGLQDAGMVLVIFGLSEFGLDSTQVVTFSELSLFNQAAAQETAEGRPELGAGSEPLALFGKALAAGDFDGDGNDDLAMAAPLSDLRGPGVTGIEPGGLLQAGALWIKYGPLRTSLTDLTQLDTVQYWSQSLVFPNRNTVNEFNGVGTPTEAGDLFGAALAAGDFNADGRDDLAVGAPSEDLFLRRSGIPQDVVNAGAVTVIYGSLTGLSITGRVPQLWHQDLISVGDAEFDDQFGASLSAWNFDGIEFRLCPPGTFCNPIVRSADLVIGVPSEDLPVSGQTIRDCGQVNVLYGSFRSNGLTTLNVQRWHQGSHPGLGGREANDRFGSALY